MLRFRTSVTVLIRGPLRLLLLHPLRPLRPLDPLDSPLGSQPPHLPLRQLPARATIHGIRRSLRPRSHRRRNRPKPTRGTSHISSLLTTHPWNQPQGNQAQAAPQPGDDPWNQPQSQTPASSVPQTVSGNMSGDDPWNQPQSVPQPAAGDDPWNQPQPAQPTPNADPWNSQPQPQPKPQPQVAAEDDEYSMSDQSLGEATAMNLDDLKKLFEVKSRAIRGR